MQFSGLWADELAILHAPGEGVPLARGEDQRAQALTKARAEVQEAVTEFCADPRIATAIGATEDAMDQPLAAAPASQATHQPRYETTQPEYGHGQQPTYSSQPASPSDWRPQRSTQAPAYDDPYLDDDYDPYYQRKSWLVD